MKRWILDTKKGFIFVDAEKFPSGEIGRYIRADGTCMLLYEDNKQHKKIIKKVKVEGRFICYDNYSITTYNNTKLNKSMVKKKRKKIRTKIKIRIKLRRIL